MQLSRKSIPTKQEVVLLDEGWVPTLYVAVGLRNAGCAVHIVTPGSGRVDVKYLGSDITFEIVPHLRTQEYLSAVGAALARRPLASVLALTEEVLYRLWDAGPGWLTRIQPACMGWQRELLRDKARLSAYVAQAGLRIPEQRLIPSVDRLDAAIRDLGLPVVVKGIVGRGGSTVRIARAAEEAHQAAVEFMKAGDCFLQQYIDGPTYLVGGLFHEGEPIRVYAGEVLERYHQTGPSFRHRSVCDPALLDYALKIFRVLRWTGLASLDVARGLDGGYYLIECNPRPWGSIGAAARTGVDLFGPLAHFLAGHIPAANLSFAGGIDTTVFPQVMASRLRGGNVRSLLCLLREPRIWLDAPWPEPGLILHFARETYWSWRNGFRVRRRRTTAPTALNKDSERLAAVGKATVGDSEEMDASPAPGG